MLRGTLGLLHNSLTQLARSSGAASGPQVALLQQLASAAADVQQQLDSYCSCSQAKHAVAAYRQGASDGGWDTFEEVARQGGVLRDAQGQPMVTQHPLLSVLQHLARLQRLGKAVCAALPPPSLACANPACDNVSGLSDMQLVWRRGVCGHCRAARFCSTACLRAHWGAHRDPGSVVAAAVCGSEEGCRCWHA